MAPRSDEFASAPVSNPTIAVFDFGGVLIDWNPRHLFRKLIGDEARMERFIATVCTSEWNQRQDAGRSLAEGTRVLTAEHPGEAALIEAYYRRWDEMVGGAIEGTVAILAELRARGVPLYALSNWSAETFPRVRARFPFLAWFAGIVLSGEVGLVKPDARIYRLLLDRFRLEPAACVYIDDMPRNVEAADAVGMRGILFTDPAALRRDLASYGLLPP